MATNGGNNFYGHSGLNVNPDKNQRPADASKPAHQLFGYQSHNINSNGAASPYMNGNQPTTNPYGSSVANNDTSLSSDQGKANGDWFSSGPSSANIINPYAASDTNMTSSSNNTGNNNPASTNPIDQTMNHSSNITPNPTNQTNDAFAGPMQHMKATQPHANTNSTGFNSNTITPLPGMEDYENEPPLLEELGINFNQMQTKSLAVILPMKYAKDHIDVTIMADDDLACPLAFVLLLGGELLLAAKMNFGSIYGLGLFGCFGMTLVLNLLSPTDSISMWTVLSVLGYSLIPVNALAGVNILYRIRNMGKFGVVLAALTIGWCAWSSTRLFERGCGLREQRFLVAYPVALFYSAFVMMTIF